MLGTNDNTPHASRLKELFQANDGWRSGHTRFRTGVHGDGWIEKGSIVRSPRLLNEVTIFQAATIQAAFGAGDLLIGASQCGAVVASFVARHCGLPVAFTDPKPDGITFHRMYVPKRGSKAILVDDLIFSGNEVRAHIRFFAMFGIELIGVSSWVNRQADAIGGVPVISLLPAPFQTYPESDCPLCQQNIPLRYDQVRE